MSFDDDACYRAIRARDRRFDGVFFVGVTTTGIYCRPVCPARTPRQDRCVFFRRPAEAERAGFRACFRCRPEVAPGSAPIDSIPRLVAAASDRIDAGYLNDHSVDDLGAVLGVTSRHLRRAMEEALGVSPIDYAQTRRLALAKQLLQDTGLPLVDVALASGFSSVRRFNAAIRERFGRPPSDLRLRHGAGGRNNALRLRLDFRPPLAWPAMLEFLEHRAIPGVETVEDGAYLRTVRIGASKGTLRVTKSPDRDSLVAEVSLPLAARAMEIAARVRRLFDLDAKPDEIASHLESDTLLAPFVRRHPGLRVPGAFDPFELAIRGVLGQQVSVKGATTIAGRLVREFGDPVPGADDRLSHHFPDPAALAAVSPERIARLGMPLARGRTIAALARAVASGRVDLASRAAPEAVIASLVEIPGIGPWTARYVAMRALGWPDAWLTGDLGLRKATGATNAREAERRAEAWRPWRAYAAMHLWGSLAQGG